jgi:hypothetical protein
LITGLPVAAANVSNAFWCASLFMDTMSGVSGSLQAFGTPATTTLALSYSATGTTAVMADTNFANNSSFSVTGSYQV